MSRFRAMLLATSATLAAVSTQPATAADLPAQALPPIPIISHWDGLYAGFSAGGTWTNAKSDESLSLTSTFNGAADTTQSFADHLAGNDIGAVFTFTMGYNVTLGSWLAGIQSEVSYNKTLINSTGSSTGIFSIVNGPTTTTIQDVRADIERNWTISEMARIGYLVSPDWLVYGLVGWSWSGFDLRANLQNNINVIASPFTLNGFTWGAGVEKDFGRLRAFIQYKGIDFSGSTNNLPAAFSSTNQINSTRTSGSDAVRLSAVASEITAGVTIPINMYRQPAAAGNWAVKAPPVAYSLPNWGGLYASFAAGGTSTNAKSSETANLLDVVGGGPFSTEIYADRLSGRDVGALFTFAMGYNVLFGPWLVGVQSEVSYNKTLIYSTGTATNNVAFTGGPTFLTSQNVQADIERKWTVSEMARIGYLVAPDWLVYGLAGWSWSGFDFRTPGPLGIEDLPFTLSGFTWGAGVEKDFGWLRAFIQYKGIEFGDKTNDLPVASARTQSFNGVILSSSQVSGSDARSLSAVAQEITAGVTIPINFHRF